MSSIFSWCIGKVEKNQDVKKEVRPKYHHMDDFAEEYLAFLPPNYPGFKYYKPTK